MSRTVSDLSTSAWNRFLASGRAGQLDPRWGGRPAIRRFDLKICSDTCAIWATDCARTSAFTKQHNLTRGKLIDLPAVSIVQG